MLICALLEEPNSIVDAKPREHRRQKVKKHQWQNLVPALQVYKCVAVIDDHRELQNEQKGGKVLERYEKIQL